MTDDLLGWLSGAPRPLADILRARVESATHLKNFDSWPVAALPDKIARLHGLEERRRKAVVAGSVLMYLAADIVDDAQDGDLPSDIPWPEAVNAGNSLLFAALAAFRGSAHPSVDVSGEVARAGQELTWGQALDLTLTWDRTVSEEEVLKCVRLKSGSSGRLYTRMAALASDQSEEIVDLWGRVGELWGMATQLRSDVLDLFEARPRDLKNRKATLPIAYALARNPLQLREALDDPDTSALRTCLQVTGALVFVDFTIDGLTSEIGEHLGRLPLSDTERSWFIDLSCQAAAPTFI